MLPPLITLMLVLLCLQDGAVLYEVSDALAVVAPLHVAAVVPDRLHGVAAACDRLGVGRMRKFVDVPRSI